MSKKQKRSVSSTAAPVAVEDVQATASPIRRFSSVNTEFNPDYSHVIQGLKRIGGLVAFFVVAMIVLTFIIK